jgi:hypothetical protein
MTGTENPSTREPEDLFLSSLEQHRRALVYEARDVQRVPVRQAARSRAIPCGRSFPGSGVPWIP